MRQPDSVIYLLKALAGPSVWAAHFFFLYLTEAFACAGSSSPTEALRWSGLAATLAALAVLALYLTRVYKFRQQDRTAQVEAAFIFSAPLALLSMVATLWTAIPLLLLPACAPPFA
jgi:phosphatidylserine synthase